MRGWLQQAEQEGFEGSGVGGRSDDTAADDVEQPAGVVIGAKGRLALDGGVEGGAEGKDVGGLRGVTARSDFRGEVGGVPLIPARVRCGSPVT